jgi:hypothetical protein
VVLGVHVLVCCGAGAECFVTGLTTESGTSVVQSIHVLFTRTTASKSLVARVAFRPVICFIHVVVTSILDREVLCTSCTFKHDELFRAGPCERNHKGRQAPDNGCNVKATLRDVCKNASWVDADSTWCYKCFMR